MLIALKLVDPFGLSYYGGLSFLVFFFLKKWSSSAAPAPGRGEEAARRRAGGVWCGGGEAQDPQPKRDVYCIPHTAPTRLLLPYATV